MSVMPLRKFALAFATMSALAIGTVSYLGLDLRLKWYVTSLADCAVIAAALIAAALVARLAGVCPRFFGSPSRAA
jgi:hypothetical protein